MTIDLTNNMPVHAPLDGSPIHNGVFVDHNRPYQVCTRCVVDTTDPLITFDDQGVCNHCKYFENNIKPVWFPNEEGQAKLETMIAEVKAYGAGKDYDCIIGMSGGIDSSYIAVKVVEWGLRPLVVHVDAGWNSELAVQNIEQITRRLGLDLVTHVIDWEEMQDVQLAFMRANVANQDVPQDHAFFAALYSYAVKSDIRYVISGSNFATESVLPQAWGYDAMDIKHLEAIHSKFGTRRLKKFPRVSFFDFYFRFPLVKKMRILAPLNYMNYDKEEAMRILERDWGWRYYGGKHYESRWTRFFQGYYLPYKFGYDKRKAHLSSLVVAGQLTRSEALEQLKRPLYTANELAEDKAFIAKKLGITEEALADLIAAPCRHYSEFPNNEGKYGIWYGRYQKALAAHEKVHQVKKIPRALITRAFSETGRAMSASLGSGRHVVRLVRQANQISRKTVQKILRR